MFLERWWYGIEILQPGDCIIAWRSIDYIDIGIQIEINCVHRTYSKCVFLNGMSMESRRRTPIVFEQIHCVVRLSSSDDVIIAIVISVNGKDVSHSTYCVCDEMAGKCR